MKSQNILKIMTNSSFTRSISTINTNGIKEYIHERTDYPIVKCRKILRDETISVLGYGPQARGQSLNLADNGFNVILGMRQGPSWDKALEDGWVENKNLFLTCEAAEQGTIIQYLLSDVGQAQEWSNIKECLNTGDTLYFSHGFGITYNDQTKIEPPNNIDVIMVAPKGAGITVRNHFLNNSGINASYAIHQDFTRNATSKALALAFGIGCGHVFQTTFEKEVYSDLTGERCVLMGMIQGAFSAQYKVLRENGHSPSEAYNETVEEALESLYPLISEKGMDWLYRNCSTTAQRGALDWAPKFEKVLRPVIQECYESVKNGDEARRVFEYNSGLNYREKLNKELDEISNQELWKTANKLRQLRPK
jgi:ketol-acid reductoisomerase